MFPSKVLLNEEVRFLSLCSSLVIYNHIHISSIYMNMGRLCAEWLDFAMLVGLPLPCQEAQPLSPLCLPPPEGGHRSDKGLDGLDFNLDMLGSDPTFWLNFARWFLNMSIFDKSQGGTELDTIRKRSESACRFKNLNSSHAIGWPDHH